MLINVLTVKPSPFSSNNKHTGAHTVQKGSTYKNISYSILQYLHRFFATPLFCTVAVSSRREVYSFEKKKAVTFFSPLVYFYLHRIHFLFTGSCLTSENCSSNRPRLSSFVFSAVWFGNIQPQFVRGLKKTREMYKNWTKSRHGALQDHHSKHRAWFPSCVHAVSVTEVTCALHW